MYDPVSDQIHRNYSDYVSTSINIQFTQPKNRGWSKNSQRKIGVRIYYSDAEFCTSQILLALRFFLIKIVRTIIMEKRTRFPRCIHSRFV